MIEMNVAGIALDATTRVPIVLLKDSTERRALPIWIGQNEARAILSVLENQAPPRPMTHDLLGNCLGTLGIKLERVIIHSLQDSTFFAVLTLRHGETSQRVDARPSDAIALALRMNAPIWVMEEVVADASIPVDQEADEMERQAFRDFIDNIRPGDFSQSIGGGESASV